MIKAQRWLLVGLILIPLLISSCGGEKEPDTIAGDYYYKQGNIDLDQILESQANRGCPTDIAELTQNLWDVNKNSPEARNMLQRAYSTMSNPLCSEEALQTGLPEAIIYVEASAGF